MVAGRLSRSASAGPAGPKSPRRLAAITTDRPVAREPGPVTAAVALHSALPQIDSLSAGEKALLGEWLDHLTAWLNRPVPPGRGVAPGRIAGGGGGAVG